MRTELTFRQYQDGLSKDIFLGLRCRRCGTVTVPPQRVCRGCGSSDLQVEELEKSGVIRTFTVIRVAPAGRKPPFVVALVETAAGAWVMGNLDGVDPDDADMTLIGRKVAVGSRLVPGDVYAGGDIHALCFTLIA